MARTLSLRSASGSPPRTSCRKARRRRRSRPSTVSGTSSRSSAPARSSRSAAAARPTRRASRRRRTSAASPGRAPRPAEAAAGYETVTHGQAVALGLSAALRLSGRDTAIVDELLDPKPVRVDRDRAWAALGRDKKKGLVLLSDEGPVRDVQLPDTEVRAA